MNKRDFGNYFSGSIIEAIDERLEQVSEYNQITILHAVESGSRAWGFPSPDSDYDCRFVYVRKTEEYLRLWPARDVIETPIDNIFDVSGWDLGKALRLMAGGNAVILEWLQSPYIYQTIPGFQEECLTVACQILDRHKIACHYYHLARKQFSNCSENEVRLKKLFYVLRPIFTIRWLMNHSDQVPPMDLPSLMEACPTDFNVDEQIRILLEIKKNKREIGVGNIPEDIRRFIISMFEKTEYWLSLERRSVTIMAEEKQELLQSFFVDWLKRINMKQYCN